MGSRAEYTEREIQRVLDENDFSDRSDELYLSSYQPEEYEETEEEENEDTVSDIEREVLRIISHRCREQSSKPSVKYLQSENKSFYVFSHSCSYV
ncbi:unnamed protein product [Arctia plantaginis]|uniref:Uncharacterized protein n=1 Tax=Arctia plantaginis TaxID=874455 RepID=A0A8S1ADG7_ARCPL|nr:unnamed protein product [Arctia plantaginis]